MPKVLILCGDWANARVANGDWAVIALYHQRTGRLLVVEAGRAGRGGDLHLLVNDLIVQQDARKTGVRGFLAAGVEMEETYFFASP